MSEVNTYHLLAEFVEEVNINDHGYGWNPTVNFIFLIVGGEHYRFHTGLNRDLWVYPFDREPNPVDHWDLIVGSVHSRYKELPSKLKERIREIAERPEYVGKIKVHLDQFIPCPAGEGGKSPFWTRYKGRERAIDKIEFGMLYRMYPAYIGSLQDGIWFYTHGECAKCLKTKHVQRLMELEALLKEKK